MQQPQPVRIIVYDMLGREVARLHEGLLLPGQAYPFTLQGHAWTSGLYLVQVISKTFRATRRVMLIT